LALQTTPSNLTVLEFVLLPFIVKIWKCTEFIHHSLCMVLHACTWKLLPFICDADQEYSNLNGMSSPNYFNLQSYVTAVLLLYSPDWNYAQSTWFVFYLDMKWAMFHFLVLNIVTGRLINLYTSKKRHFVGRLR
jgi:hypothetical protein